MSFSVMYSPSVFLHDFLSKVKVAEFPSYGTELLIQLTVCLLCIISMCNFDCNPFWFRDRDYGSDCNGSWSLFTLYLLIIISWAQVPYSAGFVTMSFI